MALLDSASLAAAHLADVETDLEAVPVVGATVVEFLGAETDLEVVPVALLDSASFVAAYLLDSKVEVVLVVDAIVAVELSEPMAYLGLPFVVALAYCFAG